MENKKEMTALDVSAATDTEQPISKCTDNSISEKAGKINDLETISMTELYDTVYPSKPPLIDGLLYTGTYLFVGAPKLGKSYLMAQLAYHISTGTPLWDYTVRKGTVLYLALEDDYRRLQERLYRMFGTDSTDNLFFSVSADSLGNGLDAQLQRFMQEHTDTSLIIIDTLQKVREVGGDNYSYANDYEIITRLKQFADKYGICILLVHHTRKQTADDKFNMISGTTGLLGAADGAFLLQKENSLDTAPEYNLPEPSGLMTAKTYKTKFAEPLIKRLKSLIKTVFARCFEAWDSYHRLNATNASLYRENQVLSRKNSSLNAENAELKEQNRDYKLLRKVFGSKQIDGLLEQAKQSKQRDKRFRDNQNER